MSWEGIRKSIGVARAAYVDERMAAKPAPRNRSEIEFLPAALEVIEMPASPVGRAILWTIMAFVAIAIAWACIGQVDVVAVAPGKVVPSGRSKVIQPVEIALVRRIHVVDGQRVKKDEVLVELDVTMTGADRHRLAADLQLAKAESARLEASLTSDPMRTFATPAGTDPALAETQRSLLRAATQEHQARIAALNEEITKRRAEHAATLASVHKLEKTVPLVRERTEARVKLAAEGFVSRITVLELQQQLIEQEQELVVLGHRAQEAAAAISSLERQSNQITAEFRRNVLSQRAESEKKVANTTQELLKAEQRHGQQKLVSPIDGVVQQLAIHTIGGVVTPAQQLMVIVPDEDVLEVEAKLVNKDVGYIEPGQEAEVKFETFLFTKYGTIPGRVTSISRDAVLDEKLGLLYPVRVELKRAVMDIEGRTVNIAPGMAVSVEIKTERRLLIEYVLSPIQRYRRESLRER